MSANSEALWIVVHDVDLACEEVASYERQLGNFGELWVEFSGYPQICALFSGSRGFLMYLRFEGDAGFTTRGSSPAADGDGPLSFVLSNGQVDEYPASWTYPREVVFRALAQFIRTKSVPDLGWFNDSGDGERLPTNSGG